MPDERLQVSEQHWRKELAEELQKAWTTQNKMRLSSSQGITSRSTVHKETTHG